MTERTNGPVAYEVAVEHEAVAEAIRLAWLELHERERMTEARIVESTIALSVSVVRSRNGAAAAADMLEHMARQLRKGG